MKLKFQAPAICVGLMLAGSALAAAAPAAAPDAKKGKETVGDQCAVCHSIDSDEKKMGPSLKGLYKRSSGKLKNGKPVNDANVKAVINAGGNGMPAYADMLSDAEKADVLAYLKTI